MKEQMSTQEFEVMYHRYMGLLYRIAFTYVKNHEDTEDILQEVFCKRLYAAPMFDSEENEKRWLIRITINLAKNYVKAFWRRNRRNLDDVSQEQLAVQPDHVELWQEVMALPTKNRIALYLHYYEGYSCKEIAQIVGSKESAVKMRLKKGRELLKMSLVEGGICDGFERI